MLRYDAHKQIQGSSGSSRMQLANGQVILHSCDEQTLLYSYHDMVDCDVRKTSGTSQQRMAKPRNVSDPKILLHESKTFPLKRLLKSEGYLAGIALELSSMLLAGGQSLMPGNDRLSGLHICRYLSTQGCLCLAGWAS